MFTTAHSPIKIQWYFRSVWFDWPIILPRFYLFLLTFWHNFEDICPLWLLARILSRTAHGVLCDSTNVDTYLLSWCHNPAAVCGPLTAQTLRCWSNTGVVQSVTINLPQAGVELSKSRSDWQEPSYTTHSRCLLPVSSLLSLNGGIVSAPY